VDHILLSLSKDRDALKSQIDSTLKYPEIIELTPIKEILEKEAATRILTENLKANKIQRKALNESIAKISKAISLGEYQESKECPVCKSTYVKTQNSDDIIKLKLDLEELNSQYKDLIEAEKAIHIGLEQNNVTMSSCKWASINEKNKNLKEAKDNFDKLSSLESKIKEYESKQKELQQNIEVMKFWELAFSEKGLIRYIIRNILEYFNLRANEYCSILTNSQFKILFDDELSETITNNGVVVKFISLSGGEKRKLNLAIMLALQDLSAKISKTQTNLIFFDEVCDNIDDPGVKAVNNLLGTLRNQYPTKAIMLITHNTLLNELLSEARQITVSKRKGVSKIEV
jgi:DNA repair exonuclease SbcCD ATPase subunit